LSAFENEGKTAIEMALGLETMNSIEKLHLLVGRNESDNPVSLKGLKELLQKYNTSLGKGEDTYELRREGIGKSLKSPQTKSDIPISELLNSENLLMGESLLLTPTSSHGNNTNYNCSHKTLNDVSKPVSIELSISSSKKKIDDIPKEIHTKVLEDNKKLTQRCLDLESYIIESIRECVSLKSLIGEYEETPDDEVMRSTKLVTNSQDVIHASYGSNEGKNLCEKLKRIKKELKGILSSYLQETNKRSVTPFSLQSLLRNMKNEQNQSTEEILEAEKIRIDLNKQINDLRKEITSLVKKNLEGDDENNLISNLNNHLKTKIQTNEKEINKLQNKIKEILREKAEIEIKLEETRSENVDLSYSKTDTEIKFNKFKEESSIVKKEWDKKTHEYENIMKDFNLMKDQNEELKKQIFTLENNKNVYEKKIGMLEEKCKNCEKELTTIKIQEEKLKSNNELLENDTNTFRIKIHDLESTKSELESRYKKSENIIASLESQIVNIKANKVDLERDYKALEEKLRNIMLENNKLIASQSHLENCLKQTKETIDKLSSSESSYKLEKNRLESNIVEFSDRDKVTQLKIGEFVKRIEDLEQKNEDLNKKHITLNSEKESMTAEINDMYHNRDVLQNEINCLQMKNSSLQSKKSDLENKINEANANNSIILTEKKELILQLEDAKYGSLELEKEVHTLNSEKTDLLQKSSQLQISVNNLRSDKGSLENKCNTMKEKYEVANNDMEHLKLNIVNLTSVNDVLEADLKNLKLEADKYSDNIKVLSIDKMNFENDIANLQLKIENFAEKEAHWLKKERKLVETVSDLDSQREHLASDKARLEYSLNSLTHKIDNFKNQNKQWEKDKIVLEKSTKMHENQAKDLRFKNNHLNVLREILEQKCKQLCDTLDVLSADKEACQRQNVALKSKCNGLRGIISNFASEKKVWITKKIELETECRRLNDNYKMEIDKRPLNIDDIPDLKKDASCLKPILTHTFTTESPIIECSPKKAMGCEYEYLSNTKNPHDFLTKTKKPSYVEDSRYCPTISDSDHKVTVRNKISTVQSSPFLISSKLETKSEEQHLLTPLKQKCWPEYEFISSEQSLVGSRNATSQKILKSNYNKTFLNDYKSFEDSMERIKLATDRAALAAKTVSKIHEKVCSKRLSLEHMKENSLRNESKTIHPSVKDTEKFVMDILNSFKE